MFKKTIDVYWTGHIDFGLESIEPDSSLRDVAERVGGMHLDNNRDGRDLKKCSAVSDYLKNTFRIKSPIDYNIEWVGNNCYPSFRSTMRDQTFFTNHVVVRDHLTGFASLGFGRMLFITEEPSLVAEQKHASYATSDFCKSTCVVEGAFDIGKWYRPFDLAFFVNYPKQLININRGDVLYYVKFHTHQKINLKRFHFTEDILNILRQFTVKQWLPSHEEGDPSKLEKFYRFFKQTKYKNYILKLIKQNVLE